jgi:hypothetical protein
MLTLVLSPELQIILRSCGAGCFWWFGRPRRCLPDARDEYARNQVLYTMQLGERHMLSSLFVSSLWVAQSDDDGDYVCVIDRSRPKRETPRYVWLTTHFFLPPETNWRQEHIAVLQIVTLFGSGAHVRPFFCWFAHMSTWPSWHH